MKCPNCRCEIGSQPTCPYCGREIKVPESKPVVRSVNIESSPTQISASSLQSILGRMNRHLSNIDMRSKLSLILLTGIFVLIILLIIIIILK